MLKNKRTCELAIHFNDMIFLKSISLCTSGQINNVGLFVMFVIGFLKKRGLGGEIIIAVNDPFLGSCYDFYLITVIQRPSMGSLLHRSKHY